MNMFRLLLKISIFSLLAACGSENNNVQTDSANEASPSSEDTLMAAFSDQADAGAETYATNCGACHGANLQGSALGPMLSGGGFLGSYGRQSPYEFFNFLKSNMPPGGNAGISDEDYWSIVAHVMRTNGVADLNPALDETASYAMATNIPGVSPTLTQQRIEPDRPTGVVASGEVENFSPVTDAMLSSPSPNDW